jgi:hypothetical protein
MYTMLGFAAVAAALIAGWAARSTAMERRRCLMR